MSTFNFKCQCGKDYVIDTYITEKTQIEANTEVPAQVPVPAADIYSIGKEELIARLSDFYLHDCLAVAIFCDEVLDRSGGLLGEVRKEAEKLKVERD